MTDSISMAWRSLAGATVFLLLAACDKLTSENYARLEPGMSYDEVVGILGKPDECAAVLSVRTCTWQKDDKWISAKLIAEKVVLLSSRNL